MLLRSRKRNAVGLVKLLSSSFFNSAFSLRERVSRVTIATIALKCACDVTCHNLNGTRVIKRHNDPLRAHPYAQLRGREPMRARVGSERERARVPR